MAPLTTSSPFSPDLNFDLDNHSLLLHLHRRTSSAIGKPLSPAPLTLEAWAQGFMVGSLIIMAFITISNMRRGVLLHKLILLELLLGMPHGTFIFTSPPAYGWYLSVTATLLNISWSLHNVIAWMKSKPFMTHRWSLIYIWTVAAVQPYWVIEIYANWAYFNGYNDWFRTTRPYEALFRDPWWLLTTILLYHRLITHYRISLPTIIRISPRFGVLLLSMILSLIFIILDILSVTHVIADESLPDGLNPFWKLAFVFKCLCDSIVLDDFKTALERLLKFRLRMEGCGESYETAESTITGPNSNGNGNSGGNVNGFGAGGGLLMSPRRHPHLYLHSKRKRGATATTTTTVTTSVKEKDSRLATAVNDDDYAYDSDSLSIHSSNGGMPMDPDAGIEHETVRLPESYASKKRARAMTRDQKFKSDIAWIEKELAMHPSSSSPSSCMPEEAAEGGGYGNVVGGADEDHDRKTGLKHKISSQSWRRRGSASTTVSPVASASQAQSRKNSKLQEQTQAQSRNNSATKKQHQVLTHPLSHWDDIPDLAMLRSSGSASERMAVLEGLDMGAASSFEATGAADGGKEEFTSGQ